MNVHRTSVQMAERVKMALIPLTVSVRMASLDSIVNVGMLTTYVTQVPVLETCPVLTTM